MSDEEIMRKAVELADGWSFQPDGDVWVVCSDFELNAGYPLNQHDTDALAAQLVRQVDALDGYGFQSESDDKSCAVIGPHFDWSGPNTIAEGPDRAMNTIRAIVDSKVLDTDSRGLAKSG